MDQLSIWHADRRPRPTFEVEEHPFAIRVSPHGPHQEFPIDIIEEALDVEIEHPVMVPASPPGHARSIMCRFPRPISMGVLVELRLQDRLQKSLDDHLGDSVGNRWNSQRPSLSSITFWYVNAAHGWGKVAAGAHPIPDLIKIITQILFKVFDRLSIDPRRPFVDLHLLVRFPHIALRYTKWLGFIHARALPDNVESRDRKGIARIQGVGACPCRKSRATFSGHALVLPLRVASTLKLDDDAPSVQSHYRTFNPITGVSAPVPRIDTPPSWRLATWASLLATGRQVPAFLIRAG